MIMRRLMVVRHVLLTVAAMLVIWTAAIGGAQTGTGEEKFNWICAACHTIGGGLRVGPDLQGVHERRSEEWLLQFVLSPQRMINSGDPVAVQLQQQFNMIVMPDPPFSSDEIKDILAYVKTGGRQGAAQAPVSARAATPDDIRGGQDLFQGLRRSTNGGPACNSCHHVRNDAVIGGGVLAKELTSVFTRLGAPGIHAILGRPPFPVMDEAYRGMPLTNDEIFALVSFLEDADRQQAFQQPRDYGFKLFYSGTAGFVVLMGLCALFGRRRKKHPVNRRVFDRQVRTQ